LPKLTATPSLSTPVVSSPTLTLSPLASATAAVPVPADAVVVFAVSGESWIEVRDANGQIILQRTLQRGEKAGAGPKLGKLPFSVIVGRTHETQVSVRGKPLDWASVAPKDGVARFEVK
jgi:cytoskeleton protein RodZ